MYIKYKIYVSYISYKILNIQIKLNKIKIYLTFKKINNNNNNNNKNINY